MKKWGLFLAMLAIAAAFAFADEVAAAQVDDLFADIEAVALSQGEMEAVDGGMGSREGVTKTTMKFETPFFKFEFSQERDAELARIDRENARQKQIVLRDKSTRGGRYIR